MKMVRETRHLWIGNLPSNICEERINDHFKRYGKVQSVKILGRSKSNEEGNPSLNTNTNNINNNNSNSTNSISISSTGNSNSNSLCATVAFIDIRSAAKAHNSENKIEERILLTGYYEPPASSTASSAIFIHESREDALLGQRPSATSVQYGNAGTSARSQRHTTSSRGLPPPEDRLYERERLGSSNNYDRMVEREPPPYIKRNISYHDEGDYSNRNRSRDRTYNRNSSTGSYPDNIDRNTNHFRAYNRSGSQHFENPRYPSSEQLDDSSSGTSQRNASSGRTRLTPTHNPSSNNNSSSIGITSTVTSPPSFQLTSATTTTTTTTAANTTTSSGTSGKSLKKKRSRHSIRSQSASPSPSHSRSTSLSSDRSQSPSSSSNLSSSSESNRSVSPKCQSPLSLYGNRRPSSHNADKSSAANSTTSSGLVATNSINSLLSQGSNHTPQHISSATPGSDCSVTDKEESRPLAICVRNLPVRSTDTSLKDGLFHEYKKHGKVTMVKVIGQGIDRFAVVCFKKAEDVEKALDVSKDKLFFGCKIEVTPHEGIDAEDNDFRPLEAELDEYHPKATRTLFVGNLEKDITTTDLRSHFEQFGEIIEIDIKKQGPSTYAFIQYSDIASVVKAMRKLDGENLGANRIKLGFGKSMPTNCVWLHGISETTSEKSLQWQCTRFGPVLNISLDRERGNCLVFYENVECAQIAVTDLKGRLLNGRKLQVDFANRECQNSFYEKVELSGQCVPSDRPWERRTSVNLSTNTTASTTTTSNNTSWSDVEERSSNYEVHSSRSHNRYENPRQGRNSYRAPQSPPPPPPPAPHPSCQRAQTLPGGRGRGYRFNENFSDRRHRTFDNDDHGQENEEFLSDDNRDFGFPREKVRDYCESRGRSYSPMRVQSDETESLLKERYTDESPYLLNKDKLEDCIIKERSSRRESTENLYSFDWKSSDSLDRSLKVRSKHKSSDGDSHKYSPSTRRLSQSTSPPPCKERKSHSQSSGSCKTPRSPTSSTSSIVNSPFKSDVMDYDVISDKDLLTVSTWRRKSAEENADGICTKENIRLPPESISDSEESLVMRDSVKRKLNSDSDTNCEKDIPTSSETIGHLERKKRLLACIEPVNTHREGSKHGILSADVARTADKKKPNDGCTFIGAALENVKPDLTDITKKQLSSSGADIKILEKNKVHLLNLIEQLGNVAPVNDTICESHIHHSVLENSDIVKQRKHQNSVVGKCKNNHGAKDASAIPVKTIDATSSVINKNLLDPRRQIPEVCSSSLSLPSVSFSQFPSSKIRRLERSDACEGSVEEFCATRVSSTDTHNGPQDVHSTTSKETDQGSSEVSSSSDKVATNKRSVIGRAAASNLTVELPMMLPLPEFAISFPGLSKSVVSHPGTPMTINNSSSTANSSQQLTHVSPKSTSIMSPLSNFSPSNAVPKRVREKTADAKAEVSTSDMCVNPNDTKTPAAPTKPVTKQEVSETTLECKPTNNCSSKQLSIEDRIRALDVKYNQWSGSSTASATAGNSSTNANASSVPATVTANVKVEPVSPCIAPTIDYSKYNIKKKSQVNANSSSSSQRSEPSDITRSLLSKSSIFDQDSKRLEHINEKYEPKDGVNSEANGASQTKPIFRTKAAAKEFSTLPVEKLSSETPSKPTPAQVHTSHDPPQTLTRKLSEPIKLPTMKKEPSLPTPSPGPQTAPPRTNSFSFAGRTSLSTTPTRTHLAPGSSLGTTIKKEPLLSPVTLSNNTCTTKDVRRDPRQLAKKENTIHSLNASQFQCAKDSAAAAAAGRKEGPSASFGKQQHSFQYNSSNSVFPSSGSSLNENSKSCSLLTQMASKKIETVQSGSCNSKKSSSAEPMEIETVDWPKVASTTATTESTKLESKSGKMEKVKGFILGGSKEGIDRSDSASSSLSIKKEKKSSPEIGKLNSEKTKHTESGKSKEERKACKREGKESSSSSLSKHESKEKCKMKIEGKTEKKGEGFKEKHKSMDKEKEKMRKDKDKERMPKEKSSKDKLKDSEQREREKANKALKAEMKKLGINLDEEPVYFSMYDKVKARSSANQSLKEAKDMESMRQKFNQLKQCRAKKDDKKDSSNQNDTDSDSDSSSRPVSKSKAKLLANSTRKRKLVIDSSSSSSSDEDESNRLIQQQKKATKKLLSSKPFNSDSESDSDFDSVFGGESVKSTSFVKKCRDTIYSSDSSPDEVTSPTSNKVKSKIPASSTDELRVNINSSDEEAKAKHLKQLNRKKEAKKKVLKEKEKYKEEKLNSKLAPAPASAPDPSKCTTKTEKEPEKGDVLKRKSSDEKVHKKRNKIKKEKEREKDKWRERNKEDGGENRVKEKEKEKGDKDEEKDKGDENEKEVESWSNNKEKRSSEDYERDDGKGKSIISKRKKKKKAKLAKQQKDRENKYGEKGSTSYESKEQRSDPGFKMDSEHEMKLDLSDYEQNSRKIDRLLNNESEPETRVTVLKCGPSPRSSESSSSHHLHHHNKLLSDSSDWNKGVSGDAGASKQTLSRETCKISSETISEKSSISSSSSKMAKKLRKEVGHNQSVSQALLNPTQKEEPKLLETRKEEVAQVEERQQKTEKQNNKEEKSIKDLKPGLKEEKGGKDGGGGVGGGGGEKLLVSSKEDKSIKTEKMKKTEKNKEEKRKKSKKQIKEKDKVKPSEKENSGEREKKVKEKDLVEELAKTTSAGKDSYLTQSKIGPLSPLHHSTAPPASFTEKSASSKSFSFSGDEMRLEDEGKNEEKQSKPSSAAPAAPIKEEGKESCPSSQSHPGGSTSAIRQLNKEEKVQQTRHFEVEAAIESRRLEEELLSDETWKRLKEPKDIFEEIIDPVLENKQKSSESNIKLIPDDSSCIFGVMGHSDTKNPFNEEVISRLDYKEDEVKDNEIDQRKIEDDLAVSALLQEMNVATPDIVKEPEPEPEPYINRMVTSTPDLDELSYLNTMPDDEPPPLQIAEESESDAEVEPALELDNKPETVMESSEKDTQQQLKVDERNSEAITSDKTTSNDAVNDLSEKPQELELPALAATIVEAPAANEEPLSNAEEPVIIESTQQTNTENIKTEVQTIAPATSLGPPSKDLSSLHEPQVFDEKAAGDIPNISSLPAVAETTTANFIETIEKANEASNPVLNKFENEPMESKTEIPKTEIDTKVEVLHAEAGNSCEIKQSSIMEPDVQKVFIHNVQPQIKQERTEPHVVSTTESITVDLPSFAVNKPGEEILTPLRQQPAQFIHVPPPADVNPSQTQRSEVKDSLQVNEQEKTESLDDSIEVDDRASEETKDETDEDRGKGAERPRRGRRAKTRKYSESSLTLPRYESGCAESNNAAGALQKRGKCSSLEKPRRSGRVSNNTDPSSEDLHSDAVNDEISGDDQASKIQSEEDIVGEKGMEVKRKRGRKKKVSGNDPCKQQDGEPGKQKERILLSLPLPGSEKGNNNSEGRKAHSPYDVFEFRDSEEDTLPPLQIESMHSSSTTKVSEMKQQSHVETEKQKCEELVKGDTKPEQEATGKEYVTELSQHGKLSITIRLHQKDGQDGNASTAEVVKTSKALLPEENKSPKADEVSLAPQQQLPPHQQQQQPLLSVPAPCEPANTNTQTAAKPTRKSARLMQQASKTTVDEVIEDVVKSVYKDGEGPGTRSSKRVLRSVRKSDDTVESDEETHDGKTDSLDADSDSRGDSKLSLRSYRITRSSARNSTSGESEANDSHNAVEPVSDASGPKRPAFPVLKVELPKISQQSSKISEKKTEENINPEPVKAIVATKPVVTNVNEVEEPESRSSPAALVDPVTGILTPIKKHVPPTPPQPPAAPSTNDSSLPKTSDSSAPFVPPVCSYPSVVTCQPNTVIQEPRCIPSVSERLHSSNTAMKLKTGKGLNFDNVSDMSREKMYVRPPGSTQVTAAPTTVVAPPAPPLPQQQVAPPLTPSSTITQLTPRTPAEEHVIKSLPQNITAFPHFQPNVLSQNLSEQQKVSGHENKPRENTECAVVTNLKIEREMKPPVEMSLKISETSHHLTKLEHLQSNVPIKSHHEMNQPSIPTSVVTSVVMPNQMQNVKMEGKSFTCGKITPKPNQHSFPESSHVVRQSMQSPGSADVHAKNLSHPKDYAQNLSTNQHSHIPHSEASEQKHSANHKPVIQTPPSTPTPPSSISSVGHLSHNLPSAGLHLRPQSQPPIIVPPPSNLGFHPGELTAFMQQQMMYAAGHPHYAALHPEIRAQHEAQARAAAAMGMNPRFPYPPGFPLQLPPEAKLQKDQNIEKEAMQQHHHRLQQDEKNKIQKMKAEAEREREQNSLEHMRAVVEEAELKRHAEATAMHPPPPPPLSSLRFPPGMPYPPIRQIPPHLLSPHERFAEGSTVPHPHVYHQGRPMSAGHHHMKSDEQNKHPLMKVADDRESKMMATHPKQFSNEMMNRPQPLFGIPPAGSPAPGYLGPQIAHSPSSLSYRKDNNSMPQSNEELHRKMHRASYPHKEMSPGPLSLSTNSVPGPSNLIPAHSQSLQLSSSHDEAMIRRGHSFPQMGSEAPLPHGPPPAHAMSQPASMHPQTPPHASQVPPQGDSLLLQRYPVMWQGLLALKNDQAAVQMHFVSGSPRIAHASLPPVMSEGGTPPVRIAQRMRLEQTQLEGVARKMQMVDEHCILLALPCGRDHMDVLQQSNNLRNGFINYLQSKQAAGIVNSNAPGSQQPAYVIHIFPSCDFSNENLARIAPDLLHSIAEIAHLLIIIATV